MSLNSSTRNFTLILFLATCLTSCGYGPCDATGPVIIYKTSGDYSNLISVNLSKDETRVTALPGQDYVEAQRPLPLANGYWLQRMVGTAYLSITIDEFSDISNHYTNEDLLRAVIDKDPFTEYYNICRCVDDNQDTAAFNRIIREGRLRECER
jgi:hypothetical protein